MMRAHNYREPCEACATLTWKSKSEFQMAFVTSLTFLHLFSSNLLHRNPWAPPSASRFSPLAAIGPDRHLIQPQSIINASLHNRRKSLPLPWWTIIDGVVSSRQRKCARLWQSREPSLSKEEVQFPQTHTVFFFYSVIQCVSSLVCHVDLIYSQLQWLKKYPSSTRGRSDRSYMTEIHESGGKFAWRGKLWAEKDVVWRFHRDFWE